MTKQTKSLFRPEVYEAMQKRLQGSSAYRGVEEAFEMFYADRTLQDFLRAYARKEDIIESGELNFTQAGEDRKIHVAGIVISEYGPYNHDCPQLFICPRQKRDSGLVVYAREEDLYFLHTPRPRAFILGEIKKISGIWRVVVPEQIAQDGVGYFSKANYRVSQAPLFQKTISKQDILEGLERVVKKLISRERK